MGFFSGISSAIGGLFSKAVDYDTSRKLQHDAQDFAASQYANRYQITTADLEKAGLNRTLAVTSGLAGNSPSSGIASTGVMQNPAIASATYLKTRAEAKESEARRELVNAQAKSATAQAIKDNIEAKRKVREFNAVDESQFGRKIMPYVEDMPSALRGPVRSGISTGGQLKEWLSDMWNAWKEYNLAISRNQRIESRKERDASRENKYLERQRRKNPPPGIPYLSPELERERLRDYYRR